MKAVVALLLTAMSTSISGMTTKLYDFTPAQIKAVLKEHNYLRSLEPATNMQEIIWDDQLASIAKDWVMRCGAEHRPLWQRQKLSTYPVIGENIWWSNERYLRTNMGSVIRDFHSEKYYYDFYTNTCQPGYQCGHYVQIVWAHTCAVGCAAAFCPYIRRGRGIRTGYMIVCNYGPGGNVIGLRPYQYGNVCSACPFTCKNGLCPSKCTAFLRPKLPQIAISQATKPSFNQWKPSEPVTPWAAERRKPKPLITAPNITKPREQPQPTIPKDISAFKELSEIDLQRLSRKSQMIEQSNEHGKNGSECQLWAQNGHCQKSPGLMLLVCRSECQAINNNAGKTAQHEQNATENVTRTMEQQSPILQTNCEDRNPFCKTWANAQHCVINPSYMIKWCPVSCKVAACVQLPQRSNA